MINHSRHRRRPGSVPIGQNGRQIRARLGLIPLRAPHLHPSRRPCPWVGIAYAASTGISGIRGNPPTVHGRSAPAPSRACAAGSAASTQAPSPAATRAATRSDSGSPPPPAPHPPSMRSPPLTRQAQHENDQDVDFHNWDIHRRGRRSVQSAHPAWGPDAIKPWICPSFPDTTPLYHDYRWAG